MKTIYLKNIINFIVIILEFFFRIFYYKNSKIVFLFRFIFIWFLKLKFLFKIFVILFKFYNKQILFSNRFLEIKAPLGIYLYFLINELLFFKIQYSPFLLILPYIEIRKKKSENFFYIQNYGNVSSIQYDLRWLPSTFLWRFLYKYSPLILSIELPSFWFPKINIPRFWWLFLIDINWMVSFFTKVKKLTIQLIIFYYYYTNYYNNNYYLKIINKMDILFLKLISNLEFLNYFFHFKINLEFLLTIFKLILKKLTYFYFILITIYFYFANLLFFFLKKCSFFLKKRTINYLTLLTYFFLKTNFFLKFLKLYFYTIYFSILQLILKYFYRILFLSEFLVKTFLIIIYPKFYLFLFKL